MHSEVPLATHQSSSLAAKLGKAWTAWLQTFHDVPQATLQERLFAMAGAVVAPFFKVLGSWSIA